MNATKFFTLLWGAIAILFACVGTLFENLIQLVNIVGSIFYGTVLGIFIVGIYIKYVRAKAIFYSALITQFTVIYIYFLKVVGYPWLNFIGATMAVLLSILFEATLFRKRLNE